MMVNETGPDLSEDKCASLSVTRGHLGPTIHQVIECRPPEWIPFIAVGKYEQSLNYKKYEVFQCLTFGHKRSMIPSLTTT